MKLFSILLIVTLAACSASFEGGTDPDKSKPQPDIFADEIQGPDISGDWSSVCSYNKEANAFQRRKLVVTNKNVVRSDSQYNDRECEQLLKKEEYRGLYRWLKITTYGGYQLQYKFDLGGGVTTTPKEEILLEDGVLHLSNFHNGFGTIDKNLPMAKSQTTPIPSPQPQKAQLASRYGEAKYAFCSNQGFGTFINLLNNDLTKEGTVRAEISYKVCGETKISRMKETTYKVTLKQGFPQIEFADGKIETRASSSGLSGFYGAPSIIGGNSGECFFLTNNSTVGIPFTYACK